MRSMILRDRHRPRPDPSVDALARKDWEIDRLQRDLAHARRDARWWREAERRVSVAKASLELLVLQVLAEPDNEFARTLLERRLAGHDDEQDSGAA